jgi:hypothetical protein
MGRPHVSSCHALLATVPRTAEEALLPGKYERNIARARTTLDTHALHSPAHTSGARATAEGTGRPRFRNGGAPRRRPKSPRGRGTSGPSRRPREEADSKMVSGPARVCTWHLRRHRSTERAGGLMHGGARTRRVHQKAAAHAAGAAYLVAPATATAARGRREELEELEPLSGCSRWSPLGRDIGFCDRGAVPAQCAVGIPLR